MKRVLLLTEWLLIILLGTACHDPKAYVVSPDNADSVLKVVVAASSIPADGLSRTTITAAITPAAASDRRELTFTTSSGTLFAGKQQGAEVKVVADVAGEAVVQLQSASVVESARVDVKVVSVVRTVTVDFTAPVPNDTFTMTADPQSIHADGFSEATITVQLKVLGTSQQRMVEFRTTAGTLTAPGVTANNVMTVGANADGLAVARLRSSKLVETARVTATALNVSRAVDVAFVAVNPSEIIQLISSNNSLPADGKSTARLTATVAPGLPTDKRTVTFRLSGTGGLFLPEARAEVTREADSSGQARVDMQADTKTGFARVTAEVDKTTSNDASIQLVQALPDRIFLRSQAVRLHSGDETEVTAELRRDVGTVTEGTIVAFSATTNTGTVIGAFRNVHTSNAQGEVTATFTLGTTIYLGPITLTASVSGGPSTSITLIVE